MRRHYEQLQAELGIKGSANITADTAPPVKPGAGMPLQAERQEEVENTGIGGRMEGAGDNVNSLNKIFSEKEIRERILSGEQPLTIDIGKQGKHIVGHNNYINGKSIITLPLQEIQNLVNQQAGKGVLIMDSGGNWTKKELVELPYDIGKSHNLEGKAIGTNKGIIHYSKNGVHVVPTLREFRR